MEKKILSGGTVITSFTKEELKKRKGMMPSREKVSPIVRKIIKKLQTYGYSNNEIEILLEKRKDDIAMIFKYKIKRNQWDGGAII